MKNKNQIFFLHFAGGSCFSYDFLNPYLKAFEVHQLELPGRGKRPNEALLTSMDEAVQDYTRQILNKLNGAPFVLFGHSMGACIGAHVVTELERQQRYPLKIILSGNAGPGIGEPKQRHLLDKEAFLTELENIGGMPKDFFEYPDLIDYFLPILKADFKIIEEKQSRVLRPFLTPIIAMMGHEEEDVKNIHNWKRFTQSDFRFVVFQGDHFFIHQHVDKIANILVKSFDQQAVVMSSR